MNGPLNSIYDILKSHWGYSSFRPLQAEAVQAAVAGRDSIVVLPTGGGKSLCFQVPAMHLPGLAVVVSPLISLMKDQVDALRACGIPAAAANSTLSPAELRTVAEEARAGRLKLLYLSPERLMTERTLAFLQSIDVSFFAVDEAHCISEWGHDFRPEYRMLRQLRDLFPRCALHAYTATATPQVRRDIARELRLKDPAVLVGSFDRPNLVYHVERRADLPRQLRTIVDRHRQASGIIYTIRRADAEEWAGQLVRMGYSAVPYHAGLSPLVREKHQEDFIKDKTRIVVATIAFGMGIDKSDVRFVIHAAAPKSLEAYQQESGRAGRDGLEAECWLFYGGEDFRLWRHLQRELPEPAATIARAQLQAVDAYCQSTQCRHRHLVGHFGQALPPGRCFACDVCRQGHRASRDPQSMAQKILSCAVRMVRPAEAREIAAVLRADPSAAAEFERLSTWGLLRHHDSAQIEDWVAQLGRQGWLECRAGNGRWTVSRAALPVLKGAVVPRLWEPAGERSAETDAAAAESRRHDDALFERLRAVRARLAEERGVAPFIVFSDASLREMARRRPGDLARLLEVSGVGRKKAADYGAQILETILEYCREEGIGAVMESSPVQKAGKNAPYRKKKR